MSSALTSLVKLVKMKMSSPHESRSVVLYSVVVFNQSGGAIVNTSTDRGCARFWTVWLGYRKQTGFKKENAFSTGVALGLIIQCIRF